VAGAALSPILFYPHKKAKSYGIHLARDVHLMKEAREFSAPERSSRWRRIVALNCVSAFAQIGQYGIPFMLFPLALEPRHRPAVQIGSVNSSLSLGLLLGLILAPRIATSLSYAQTVGIGLAISSIALLCTPFVDDHWWTIAATIAGMGWGLRWIGTETWLFGIAPPETRGRVVGFHESLLAVAAVVGPGVIGVLGAENRSAFLAAACITAVAAIPLLIAGKSGLVANTTDRSRARPGLTKSLGAFFRVGIMIAGVGGLIEGGVISLFPVFAAERDYGPQQIAWVLSIFGLGALLLQFPLGWLTDAKGLKVAAWT
jgi:MFS family permease